MTSATGVSVSGSQWQSDGIFPRHDNSFSGSDAEFDGRDTSFKLDWYNASLLNSATCDTRV